MPIPLMGNWDRGFALDLHTKSSSYAGVDEFGRDKFDTTRTEVGEYVYRLKYRRDTSVLPSIVGAILSAVRDIGRMDFIVPVPPSKERAFQPVYLVADALGSKTRVRVVKDEVLKVGKTPELKAIADPAAREKILGRAFSLAGRVSLSGANVLLLDDLYRSGATLRAVTRLIRETGKAKAVCVLALTKTRSKR